MYTSTILSARKGDEQLQDKTLLIFDYPLNTFLFHYKNRVSDK